MIPLSASIIKNMIDSMPWQLISNFMKEKINKWSTKFVTLWTIDLPLVSKSDHLTSAEPNKLQFLQANNTGSRLIPKIMFLSKEPGFIKTISHYNKDKRISKTLTEETKKEDWESTLYKHIKQWLTKNFSMISQPVSLWEMDMTT